ncbi:uncharacterized protein LOC134817524 [Bolinopsis microptera]|uniref:uncharacterized protein LOC134817524 n=1 Tax=Bolinopsis microptera TaxID=2820187 RepID=UPI00307938D6
MPDTNLTFAALKCPTPDSFDWNKRTDLVQGIVFTFVGIATIVLNFVMAAVYKIRGFGKPTNRAMFCITLSDVGGGFVGLYVGIYLLAAKRCWFDTWYLDEIMCYLWPMLWLCCTFATTQLVPLISIIRFVAVVIPLKFNLMKSKHVMLAMLVSGALSSAAALYPIFCGGFMKIPQQAMCIFDLTQRSLLAAQVYGWIFNFLPTIISVIVIIVTNTWIVCKLMKPSRVRARRPSIPMASVIGNQTVGNLGTVPEDSIVIENRLSTASQVRIDIPSVSQQFKRRVTKIETRAKSLAGRKIVSGQSKTIFYLAMLYLVCYAQKVWIYGLLVAWPNKKFHELLPLHMSTDAAELFFRISDYCVTINSFLNPIIYFAFSSRIRREFLHVLSCGSAGASHITTAASRAGQSNMNTNTNTNSIINSPQANRS